MKTIGLLGGMSWESTAVYYRQLNEAMRDRLGGLHSARVLLYSFDFDEVVQLQRAGRWDLAADLLAGAAAGLAQAGAQCVLIGTNTMHLVAEEVAARTTARHEMLAGALDELTGSSGRQAIAEIEALVKRKFDEE